MKHDNKLCLIPDWDTATHRPVFNKICSELGLRTICAEDVVNELSLSYRVRARFLAIVLFPYFCLLLLTGCIQKFQFRGVNLGKPLSDEGIACSKYGQFSFFKKGKRLYFRAFITYFSITQVISSGRLKLVLGGDDAYLDFSIASQLASKSDIPVRFLKGATNVSLHHFDEQYFSAFGHFKLFKDLSVGLDQSLIGKAETQVRARVYGDRSSLSYMPSERCELGRKIEERVVLFLHDFFDSPGIYGGNLFDSHWAWCVETLQFYRDEGVKIAIKTHPNARPQNLIIVDRLRARFSNDHNFLDSDISIADLLESRVSCIVSVYGSVVVEAAYAGIPAVVAGYSLYTAAGVANFSDTKKGYFELLSQGASGELKASDRGNALALQALNSLTQWNLPTIRSLPFDDLDAGSWDVVYGSEYPSHNYQRRDKFLHCEQLEEYMVNLLQNRMLVEEFGGPELFLSTS